MSWAWQQRTWPVAQTQEPRLRVDLALSRKSMKQQERFQLYISFLTFKALEKTTHKFEAEQLKTAQLEKDLTVS